MFLVVAAIWLLTVLPLFAISESLGQYGRGLPFGIAAIVFNILCIIATIVIFLRYMLKVSKTWGLERVRNDLLLQQEIKELRKEQQECQTQLLIG